MEYGLVVRWLVMYFLLGLASLPLAARLFRRFPDRGASLSLPLSLAVIGLVTFWVGHLSLALGLAVGLVVLIGLSVLSLRGLDRHEFDVRQVVAPAVVFVLAFSFMIAIRAVDPAVHPGAGEKFLDFGLLSSLLRTTHLPPEDFWFAGKPVQYYYGGHLIAALLAKLSFTGARYAYNLALAGFYAMVVTAAYGLAGAIAAERGYSARTAGVCGAFFVGFASNLETPARGLLLVLPEQAARTVAGWLGVEIEGLAASVAEFGYWNASRVIQGTINEFPFFAWLNGDLHAHMMSTPFLLLVAALWFAYYRTPADALRRRRLLVFGAVPPVAGLLVVINTWGFPTAVGMGWLALTFAESDPTTLFPQVGTRLSSSTSSKSGVGRELRRTTGALAVAVVVLVLGIVWSLLFWLGAVSGRSIGVLPDRSALGPLLLVHGAFLLVFVPYLFDRGRRLLDGHTREAVLAVIVGMVALAWLFDAAAIAVFGPLLLVGWLVLATRRDGDLQSKSPQSITVWGDEPAESDGGTVETGSSISIPAVGFETVLLVAGVGLVLLVEFVYLKNNAAPGRFNTVFKVYMQVWVLFGTAAGAVAAWLADARPSWSPADAMTRNWRVAGRALLVLVVISTSIYGALALTDHFTNEGGVKRIDEPTLDALAFVSALHPAVDDAIEWLDNRTGQPNMVSVPGCWCNEKATLTPYHWVNAPSSLTGIPTVAGWDHAGDYHGREAYLERVEDVETIYQGSLEETVRLLKKYDVQYIYVGPNERSAYDGIDFSGIEGITPVFQTETVTIYRVDID